MPKLITFGTIPAGVGKEKTIQVKNVGSTEVAFAFDPPPPGVSVRPMRGNVRNGGSKEVTVELTSDQTQASQLSRPSSPLLFSPSISCRPPFSPLFLYRLSLDDYLPSYDSCGFSDNRENSNGYGAMRPAP